MRNSILLLTLLLASCAGRQVASTKYIGAPEYDEPWNIPTISHHSTDCKYVFAGDIGYRDRGFQDDTLVYPPIPGLVHKSVYSMCPVDTCMAEYAALALRCPQEQPLLDWMADTVCFFVNYGPVGSRHTMYTEESLDIKKQHFGSEEEICQYYMNQLSHLNDEWTCPGTGDHDIMNESAGLLIADCWRAGDLCTFYRVDWYDFLSCGNTAHESWITVDAKTGKELGLEDLVLPEKFDDLSALMMPRLVNDKGEVLIEQNDSYKASDKDVLARANGCGLIREGLIIYFYPYNLGCGADGQYNAVIPYEELDGILK